MAGSEATNTAQRVNVLFKYREAIRQKLSLDMGMFLPTANQVRWGDIAHPPPDTPTQRNLRMLNETTRYARLIRHLIKKIKTIAQATDALIHEADAVITSPLPRQFTLRGGLLQVPHQCTQHAPQSPPHTAQHLDLDGQVSHPPPANEKLTPATSVEAAATTTQLQRDLDTGVFAPLNGWLDDQAEARRRFKDTEGVRP